MRYKLPKRIRDGLVNAVGGRGESESGFGQYGGSVAETPPPPPVEDVPTATTGSPIDMSNLSWSEKALNSVWQAAVDSSKTAAESLEEVLRKSGYEVDFEAAMKEYTDKGYNPEEATAKAYEAFSGMLNDSDLTPEAKAEADRYLKEAVKPAADQDPTSFEFFMNQFKETDEGKAILQDMYHGQNEYVASNQFDQMKDEVLQQNGLLDNLIEQSQTNTGLFSPISFKIGGQEVSFVPRAARAQAEQLANFGQWNVNNAASLFGTGLGLDKIIQDAAQFTASDQNVDQQREANEPGILDTIKAVPIVGDVLGGIASIFGF